MPRETEPQAARETHCGAPANGGPCVEPRGHNMGRADVPDNHRAARETLRPDPLTDLRAAAQRVVNEAETDDQDGEYIDWIVPAEAFDNLRAALRAATPDPANATLHGVDLGVRAATPDPAEPCSYCGSVNGETPTPDPWRDALADPAFVVALEQGIADIEAGRVTSWADILRRATPDRAASTAEPGLDVERLALAMREHVRDDHVGILCAHAIAAEYAALTPDRAASTAEPGLDTFDDVMRLAARLEAEVHAGTLPIDAIGVEGILRSLAKMLDPDRYRALRAALTPDETEERSDG